MRDQFALGIEIGGTKLQLGLGRGDGELSALERLSVVPERGAPAILDQIVATVPVLLARAGLAPSDIEAVGVGFGGPVDSARGETHRSFQVAGWDRFPLARWLRERLGIPRAVIENDADVAGLAEARFGAGAGYSPVLYMNVGSGIGGALIVDRRIYRGAGQGALEIGHLNVVDTSAPDRPIRELEHVASGWAIARAGQDLARVRAAAGDPGWVVLKRAGGDSGAITGVMVADAARAGDPDALAILDRARSAIAFALSQAITLLAPTRIVLGGGVSLIEESLWLDPIRRAVDRDVFPPFRGLCEIVPAALGEEMVVHGALAVATDLRASGDP
jgi:glucokinase